jgi:rubrerythrin
MRDTKKGMDAAREQDKKRLVGFPNLEQTLRNIIEAAEVAAGCYGLLAESTRDPGAKELLESLVAREKAHAQAIEMMALEMTDRALPRFADRLVDMASAAEEWRFVNDITLEQAIDVAVDAASHSALVFGALADGAEDPVRGVLAVFAEQQEALVNHLMGLRKSARRGPVWNFRQVARSDARQGLRNGIAAENAAARLHTLMSVKAADRATRIFLEQLAIDELGNAETLEILVLEHSDWVLPPSAEAHSHTIKVVPGLQMPDPVSLPAALEHALMANTLGARYYRVLASLATGAIAGKLDEFAREQEEHTAALVARRNTYWRTQASDVPSASPQDLARLLGEKP